MERSAVAVFSKSCDWARRQTFEVPTAFEDALEDDLFQAAVRAEVEAERGFAIGEGGFQAEGDDESAGGEPVADGVGGADGFAVSDVVRWSVGRFPRLARIWAGVAIFG